MIFHGPGTNFEVLIDSNNQPGLALPKPLREIFGGDWVIPDNLNRAYSFSNFVMSHDGKVSFNLPGQSGGGEVSGFNPHDQWLMALLRARSDAVVVGANTLRTEPEHQWTAEFIFPKDAEGFAQLRYSEQRQEHPLQVMVTRSGEINSGAEIFAAQNLRIIIATTKSGQQRLPREDLRNTEILVLGESEVDLAKLYKVLYEDFECKSILCEGGPRLYGSLIAANQLDEEWLTYSPVLVGADTKNLRPGLIEDFALEPEANRRVSISQLRRAGDHLFLRSNYR